MRATTISRSDAAVARSAGLRYVSDARPGIRRLQAGAGFHYIRGSAGTVRDAATLARIRKLAIPPAWTDVWICPQAMGHMQATGRDARGRKQYRYHEAWRSARDETKYGRMLLFARALPRIRGRVARDLRRKGLPREKVLAAIVRIMDTTYMRVGNDVYRKTNGSHGLTTLQDRHATFRGGQVMFRFRGKSGVQHRIGIKSRALARIVKRCQDLPGQELFQYLDERGRVRDVGSTDVNEYLREASGGNFTAKDFRTWAGTLLATCALRENDGFRSASEGKRQVVAAIKVVAERLGNTPAVCRKCYVHPGVLEAYLEGAFEGMRRRQGAGLTADERAMVSILRARPARGA